MALRLAKLKIMLKYKRRRVRLEIATRLLKLAARADSDMVERFAYDYAATHYEDFTDYQWQQLREDSYANG